MYGPIETALKAALQGVIDGVPVLGHLDMVDLDRGPSVQIKLSYLGYRPRAQAARSVADLEHRWAALLLVNAARLDPVRHAQVEAGFRVLVERVLAFRYDRWIRPTLEPTPDTGFAGTVLEMGVFFTLNAVAHGAPQETPQ